MWRNQLTLTRARSRGLPTLKSMGTQTRARSTMARQLAGPHMTVRLNPRITARTVAIRPTTTQAVMIHRRPHLLTTVMTVEAPRFRAVRTRQEEAQSRMRALRPAALRPQVRHTLPAEVDLLARALRQHRAHHLHPEVREPLHPALHPARLTIAADRGPSSQKQPLALIPWPLADRI